MHCLKVDGESERSGSGVSTVTGTLLMVALTVVIASVIFYLAVSMNVPQNLTKTSMKIMALSSSTLSVTSMVGDSIPIDNVNIIVGPITYNASGIADSNDNGLWDPGETIFLYGLDLEKQTSVVIATDTQILMPGTVQWSYNPVPANTGNQSGNSTFTSYKPGMRMTAFDETSFTDLVTSSVADDINYASPGGVLEGYQTNDFSWPLSDTGQNHNFSIRFEGFIYVDENNTYSFHITASDSISMLIDDMPIISMAGDHAPLVHMTDRYMSAGYHKLMIEYVNYDNLAVIGDFGIKKLSDGSYGPPSLFYLENINT